MFYYILFFIIKKSNKIQIHNWNKLRIRSHWKRLLRTG